MVKGTEVSLLMRGNFGQAEAVEHAIDVLAPGRRREEIARMLAGADITAEARAAADRLLRPAVS
jgi:DNA repair protein RecN (Recombination protein N)